MRVLYLHQYFNTPSMSGSTRSYEMARRLVTMGHQVILITSDREGVKQGWHETIVDGIQVHWFSSKYSNRMSYFRRILAFFRFAFAASIHSKKLKYDIVFATSTPLTIAIPGVLASRRRKVPMVFEVRDLWPAVPIALGAIRNPLLIAASKALEKFAYKHSARIVALAPGMKEHIISRKYPADLITVIPNGCDAVLQDLGNLKFDTLGEQGKRLEGHPIILYAGTLGLVNGTEWIVRVAAKHLPINPNTLFLLIGDGRKKNDTVQLAKRLGVYNQNTFFLPAMPKRELLSWFNQCIAAFVTIEGPDFYVRDSVCNKFFDAISAGKPIFANHHGFSIDVAVNADCAKVLPKDEVAAAETIASTLRDIEWMNSAPRNAKELANSIFSRDKLAGDLAQVLESATNTSVRLMTTW